MTPPALYAIHWHDRDEPEREGMFTGSLGSYAPAVWTTREQAEACITLNRLDVQQVCEVAEYVSASKLAASQRALANAELRRDEARASASDAWESNLVMERKLTALQAELRECREGLARKVAVLRRLQWSGVGPMESDLPRGWCPVCGRDGSEEPHAAYCTIAAEIEEES